MAQEEKLMIASKKTVVILIIVLLLLSLGVYFALMYNPQSETDIQTETEGEKEEYITVFERDKESLNSISISLDNESFVFEKFY